MSATPLKKEAPDSQSGAVLEQTRDDEPEHGENGAQVKTGSDIDIAAATADDSEVAGRYFGGSPENMGMVSAIPAKTFQALCKDVLCQPIQLPITRGEFLALSKEERNRKKRVRFIVPAAFAQSPAKRRAENALRCNLVCLDVDDPQDARQILEGGIDGIGRLAYAIWPTASSTPEAPRLRVVVSAEGIPVKLYAKAVRRLASMLGLPNVNPESQVPVQPMYLPVKFKCGVQR